MKKLFALGAVAVLLLSGCTVTVPEVTPPSPGTTCTFQTTGTGASVDCPTSQPTTATPTTPAPTTAAPTTAAPPTTPPPAGAWPTAATTGHNPATITDEMTSGDGDCTISSSVSNMLFNCRVIVNQPGVTITNSVVRGGPTWGPAIETQGAATSGTPLEIVDVSVCATPDSGTLQERSTCNPPTGACRTLGSAVSNGNYRVTRMKVLNVNEGFRVGEGQGNVIVEDSYVKLCTMSDEHADGIQGYQAGAAQPIEFNHNTIDMRCGLAWHSSMPGANTENLTGDPGDKSCSNTSTIFWSDASVGPVVFHDNLVAGAGYTIRLPAGTGHQITDNKVVRDAWAYGSHADGCHTWTGNQLVDADLDSGTVSNAVTLNC
jgi:hypothetical protein